MYTIGEVQKITGISRDRLRYYEKKEILKPGKLLDNRYRQYDIEDIIEVLSIEHLRTLDLGMKEIKSIRDQGDIELLSDIIARKQESLKKEIKKMQQTLLSLEDVSKACERVRQAVNQFSIKAMPHFKVLGELSDSKAFTEYDRVHKLKAKDLPIIKSFMREITFSGTQMDSNKMLILEELNTDRARTKNIQRQVGGYEVCLYTIVEEALNEEDIMLRVFNRCMTWMEQNDYESRGVAFIKVLFITYPAGKTTSYLEVYVPMIKKS